MHQFLLTTSLLLTALPALAQAPDAPADPAAGTPAPAAEAPAPTTEAPAPATEAAAPASTGPAYVDPAVAQTTYNAQKLQRKPLEEDDALYLPTLRAFPDQTVAPWAVLRGDGTAVTAHEFATLTGDKAELKRMDRANKGSKALRWGLTGAGVVLVGLAALPLVGMEDVGDLGDEPDPANYPDAKMYTDDLQDWRQRREDANQNQNRLLTAVTLGTSGALALAVSPFPPSGTRERQKVTPAYYTIEEADEKILTFNAGLKRQLGLSFPDPTEVVIQAPPPPTNDLPEEDSDEDIDIPEPSGGDEGPMPSGGPSAPPLDAPGLPTLQLSPVIGIGYLGIQGTF